MKPVEQLEIVDAGEASSDSDTGEVFSESSEDLVRTTQEARVALWQYQLEYERLTPLLQKEMKGAIEMTTKALQKPRLSANVDLMENLEDLYDHITDHWCKVFKSPWVRSTLLANINHYEVFFAGMLFEDYLSRPVNPLQDLLPDDHWFSQVSSYVQQHRQAQDGSVSIHEEGFQESLLFPLEELNLGSLLPHAENRLCAAAAARQTGARCTGAYVSQLIQACDWQKLAETLILDRQLITNFSSHNTIHLNSKWLAAIRPEILQKMDDLEQTYFTNLSGPTNFSISGKAADLLAKHSSSGPDRAPLSPVSEAERHASSISTTIGKFRLLANGLKWRFAKTTAISSVYPDDKHHLMYQDQNSTATFSIRSDEKASLLD